MCWSLQVSLGSWALVGALSVFLWHRNWKNDRWFAALLLFVGQARLGPSGRGAALRQKWKIMARNSEAVSDGRQVPAACAAQSSPPHDRIRGCQTAHPPPAFHSCPSSQVQGFEAALWLDQGCRGANQAATWALLGWISLEPLAHSVIVLACTPRKARSPAQWALAAAAAAFAAAFAAAAGAPMDAAPQGWCSRPCGMADCGAHLRWPWVANINDSWRLAFLAFLAAPLAFMRPWSHALAGAAYAFATFAIAHALFNPAEVFESMWCWLAVGGFAVPLLLGRPPARVRA